MLAGRNSYSKTDPDATFMRTKEDHLGNGQLKPCYNIQLGTENQFIINYSTHQTSSDMAVFIEHMDDTLNLLENIQAPTPKRVCGDAGYGNEQNYEYLEDKDIEAFLKYPGYYKERTGKYDKSPFHVYNLHYNEAQDYYVCPMGQHMTLQRIMSRKTSTGYEQKVHVYEARRCEGCPLRSRCHRTEGNRIVTVNHRASCYRKKARQRLDSLRGLRMREQRGVDTEPVFGHFKRNRSFRRYRLRGKNGVNAETGLLSIAHNLKKWWSMLYSCRNILPKLPTDPHENHQIAEKSPRLDLILEKISA